MTLRQSSVRLHLVLMNRLCWGALLPGMTALGCHLKSASRAPGGEAPPAAVGPPPGGNLIKNAHFETPASIPWMTSFTAPASGSIKVEGGALCITIDNPGIQPWDAQLRHREMVALKDHVYTTSFRIWANQPGMARLKLGKSGPPYSEYWFQDIPLTEQANDVRTTFTMRGPTDSTAEFAFHLGGRLARDSKLPLKVCIDDVYLSDPQFTPPKSVEEERVSPVRVNQVGYFPKGRKLATWVSPSVAATEWTLHAADGAIVERGMSKPLGLDAASGDPVHEIDFSSFEVASQGLRLEVDGQKSPLFGVSVELYRKVEADALSYFYHNRSGVPIELPYAGDKKWVRPAGHQKSDKAVPCASGIGCSYELDVAGGWYDAGDHGKYVVNGGVAVWTLLNSYERALSRQQTQIFADGTANIPENKNGVPDVLDEARFELEFLLRMQVPDGKPHVGMVHHKIHDVEWTALGIRPDEAENTVKRALRPVSTAATLNLAATAAQAARLYAPWDAAFARRALAAGEVAYQAALREPEVYASPTDGQGGGAYDDQDVSDEFFWAAVELWLTTGKLIYSDALKKSRFFGHASAMKDGGAAMNWRRTEVLGALSVVYARSKATDSALQKAEEGVVLALAERYLKTAQAEGYRVPHAPDAQGKYYWGSNSDVMNNGVVLGAAFDLTQKPDYLTGAGWAMDYLLGRNALGQSYVTGYGTKPLKNPHHRFWAHQADANFPEPPPGAVSGGPNSELQDPYAQAAGLPGCAPQKCFVDHIEAYSVNEITINWNAPLVWLTSYLEHTNAPAPSSATHH